MINRWDKALNKCPTTGSSATTAGQDGLRTGGVSASEKMAQTDWPKLEKHTDRFYQAAVKYDVPPAIIAAICSRESRGGSALAADGTGDKGRAFGLMQVDRRYHKQAGAGGDPGSQAHLNQGTEIYARYRSDVQRKHTDWGDGYLLKGAAVAYNSGVSNVQSKAGMDRGTTGNDYGSDVIARAKFYSHKLKSLSELKTKPMSHPHKITALKNTFLKKETKQATQLNDNQLVYVERGKSYGVEAYKKAEGGHYWVRLASNSGEWYIYDGYEDGHWDTTWEGDETETQAPAQPDTGTGTIHGTPGLVNWSDNSQRISKYFTVGEVTLNDSRRRPTPNSAEEKHILNLAKELDKVREDWGSAIRVTSWYRPPAVNKAVGGVSNSQHIYGRAVDIQPVQGDINKFQSWLDTNWYGALGLGSRRGFVHLDTRNGKGWKSGGSKGVRWNY